MTAQAKRETVESLRHAAEACRACPLWERATQVVFGEGPAHAPLMLVGEQPGDQEDRSGHPFVGPAGKLLDHVLHEAGIDRARVYVTNAVKHFKWEPRGKRRLHSKPNAAEIHACQPWIRQEIAVVKPRVLVCLGATAAQSLLGKTFKVTNDHGKLFPSDLAEFVLATVHPSSLLRAPTEEARHLGIAQMIDDLRVAATHLPV